jgi:hypothetical protein
MPAKSKKQAIMMAIAEHAPGELFERNKAVLDMPKKSMHDFATTPRKGLPYSAKKKKRKL